MGVERGKPARRRRSQLEIRSAVEGVLTTPGISLVSVKGFEKVPITSVSQDKAVGGLKRPTGKIVECPCQRFNRRNGWR